MTVTQLLLRRRDCVREVRDIQTDRQTKRKKVLVWKLVQRCQGFSILLKFHYIEMWLIPLAFSWDRVETRIYSPYNPHIAYVVHQIKSEPSINWCWKGVEAWGERVSSVQQGSRSLIGIRNYWLTAFPRMFPSEHACLKHSMNQWNLAYKT